MLLQNPAITYTILLLLLAAGVAAIIPLLRRRNTFSKFWFYAFMTISLLFTVGVANRVVLYTGILFIKYLAGELAAGLK